MSVRAPVNARGLSLCVPKPGQTWTAAQLELAGSCLERMSAQERVQWALDFLPGKPILTSSFGAQSAVMLHLVNTLSPGVPVVLIDTGYLFPETYGFIDQLTERLSLNLNVFRPKLSPAWQERRYGKLWESGAEGISRYNFMNKVEPMQEALKSLQAGIWFSGLRRAQSESRKDTPFLVSHGNAVKVHPLADWGDRDVYHYLKQYDLPYHPLWNEGYISIGDVHTTRPLSADISEEETRFFGLMRECGVNEPKYFQESSQTADT